MKSDIFGITKSRLRADKQPINSIDLQGYVIETTPTSASYIGTLRYINKNINFKLRNDLIVYKHKELESVFIEMINKKGKNTIVGYRHPCMGVKVFNDVFLLNILEKFSYQNKEIILAILILIV